jgi:two-component system, OmpR family, sensor histidine kinase TctE
MQRPRSLRTQLLLGLLVPTLAFVALGAWALYRSALQSAHTAFDRQLVSAAQAIADTLKLDGGKLSVSVPYAVLELHDPAPGSTLFYRVTGLQGERLAGDEALPRHRLALTAQAAAPANAQFQRAGLVQLYEDQVAGQPVRVAVVYQPVEGHDRAGLVPVQVAEPLANRELIAAALLRQTLLVQGALVLAVVGVTWLVVTRALQPLGRLREQVDQRAANDWAPLVDNSATPELTPIVGAINGLMLRVRGLLEQQQRFVADAAHQLRTPLAVLRTQLQSGLAGDVPPAALMQEMLGTVQRATTLSHQLLSMARVEQLRSHGAPGVCALGAAARAAALELSPLIAARDLAFSLDVPPDLTNGQDVCATAHPWLVGELLQNLLRNAISHAPVGSALGVTLDVAGQSKTAQARLVVWDEGPGIAAADRQRVFEPFVSGLGLAICQAIVQSLGGTISLAAHRAGEPLPGLRVTVCLPLAGETHTSPPTT